MPTIRSWKSIAAFAGSLAFVTMLGFTLISGLQRPQTIEAATVSQTTPGLPDIEAATASQTTPGLPDLENSRDAESPTISFIDSPSATCYLPTPGTGSCYIQWNYMYVTAASGSYIISATISIDNRLRAYHAGFFQTAMYIPGDMMDPGFRVTCGELGSGGNPLLGKMYAYTIRARETTGNSSANYGSVTCPADLARIYLPVLPK